MVMACLMQIVAESAVPEATRAKARALAQALFYGSLLLIILFIASVLIIRFSRAFRAWLIRPPKSATPAEDVWAMHRAPDLSPWDEDQPDEPPAAADDSENGPRPT